MFRRSKSSTAAVTVTAVVMSTPMRVTLILEKIRQRALSAAVGTGTSEDRVIVLAILPRA